MFGLGPWELAAIGSVILLVAGPAFLPRLGRTVGKTLTSLRESAVSFSTNIREEMSNEAAETPVESSERLLGASTEQPPAVVDEETTRAGTSV